jgi:cysteine sulfinate desulfinase/cysteine desulfurase-like protein
MMSSKVKEAYLEGERLAQAVSFSERRATLKQIIKAKDPILDLIGAKKENHLYFLPSMEEVLLKTVYEVLMPVAQRSGRNEILVPKGERKKMVEILKSAGRLGLSVKEIEVDTDGKVTKETLMAAISKRSLALFSSWTEAFTGVLHPVFEIANICAVEELFLFVDATESAGKVFFRFQDLPIDVLVFAHQNLVAVAAKEELKGSTWGEDFCLKEYFALSAYAGEELDMMDIHPMQYSLIKNEVIEKATVKDPSIVFFNNGGGYLYDRWCFAFEGVSSENLAYHLRVKGIIVSYQGVSEVLENRGVDKGLCACAVSMSFTTQASKESLFEMWDRIIDTAKQIKELSYA